MYVILINFYEGKIIRFQDGNLSSTCYFDASKGPFYIASTYYDANEIVQVNFHPHECVGIPSEAFIPAEKDVNASCKVVEKFQKSTATRCRWKLWPAIRKNSSWNMGS